MEPALVGPGRRAPQRGQVPLRRRLHHRAQSRRQRPHRLFGDHAGGRHRVPCQRRNAAIRLAGTRLRDAHVQRTGLPRRRRRRPGAGPAASHQPQLRARREMAGPRTSRCDPGGVPCRYRRRTRRGQQHQWPQYLPQHWPHPPRGRGSGLDPAAGRACAAGTGLHLAAGDRARGLSSVCEQRPVRCPTPGSRPARGCPRAAPAVLRALGVAPGAMAAGGGNGGCRQHRRQRPGEARPRRAMGCWRLPLRGNGVPHKQRCARSRGSTICSTRAYVGSVIVNDGNGRYYEPGPGRSFLLGMEWNFRP